MGKKQKEQSANGRPVDLNEDFDDENEQGGVKVPETSDDSSKSGESSNKDQAGGSGWGLVKWGQIAIWQEKGGWSRGIIDSSVALSFPHELCIDCKSISPSHVF